MRFGRCVQKGIKSGVLGIMLLAAACSMKETMDPISGPMAFEGTGSTSVLSQSELATYLSDRSYIQSLAPVGKSVYINHADPRQHSFVLARLKMNGKTPETSPRLFEAIEQLKQAQTAQRLKAGSMLATTASDGSWQSVHNIGPLGKTNNAGDLMGSAVASRKDPLNYGYVDTTVWDGLGNQLGDQAFYEVFGSMPNHSVVAFGSSSFAMDNQIQTDSLMIEIVTKNGEMHSSYVLGPVVALDPVASLQVDQAHPGSPSPGAVQAPGPLNANPATSSPVVIHPRQAAGVTVPSKICLSRESQDHADCRYYNDQKLSGQDLKWKVRVPLQGSLSFAADAMYANYRWDLNTIGQLKMGTNVAGILTDIGLYYYQGGGACMSTGGNPAGEVGPLTAQDFWNSVAVSPDGRTISWDMATDLTKWARFSESCQLQNTPTYVTMNVYFPYKKSATDSFSHSIKTFISNDRDYPPCPMGSTAELACLWYSPDMTIVNSCLAEGTRVAIDGATARKIEDLHLGDKVSNPYTTSLTIMDTIAGTEATPMVRIADDKDHDLLLTEMHPLYVEGRGMVPAKLLKVGDPVRTDMGPSRLIRVTREAFAGKVYNLKLGNHDEAMKLGVDQTAMYANGFLVGDAQIQDRYQTMETEQLLPTKSDGKLSSRWRKDYQQSLDRAASAAARSR